MSICTQSAYTAPCKGKKKENYQHYTLQLDRHITIPHLELLRLIADLDRRLPKLLSDSSGRVGVLNRHEYFGYTRATDFLERREQRLLVNLNLQVLAARWLGAQRLHI
jgi:hypothetical protein